MPLQLHLWPLGYILGLLMVFALPPFQGPDEFNHFFRAWQVSEGQWLGIRTPDQRLGGHLPVSLMAVAAPFRHLPFRPEGKITPQTIVHTLRIPLNPEARQFTDFANTAIYAPTAYLPQAAVMAPLRWAGVNPLAVLYAGRIAGLLCWLVCCHAAIRLWPPGRLLFTALALLPSALALHATLTADTLTNGCCFVLLALLLRLAQPGQQASGHLGWGIALLTIAIAAHKIVYAPLVGLLLLGWQQAVKRRYIAVMAALLLAGSGLTIWGWNQITRALFISYDAYHVDYRDTQQLNEGVDPAEQVRYILREPTIYTRIMVVSLLHTAPSAAVHYIGKFGWEKNYLPWPFIIALLMGLFAIISAIPDGNDIFDSAQRILLLTCAVSMTVALAVVMYLLWNPVGASFIHNLGGKYFIPIVPLLLLTCLNNRLAGWQSAVKTSYETILLISFCWIFGQIIMRYYC